MAGLSFTEATLQFQRDLIRAAIREADGNVSEAARSLGMDRSNFHRKARKILGEELDEWMERGRSAPSAAAPGGGDRNC